MPTTYPPLPFVLFFGTLILFASCGKDFTGLQRYIVLIGNLAPSSQAFLLRLIGNLPQAEASLLCAVGNLASQAFLFVCFVGLQRVWGRVWTTVCQGFCVVYVFTYHFGMLVVRCVCNPFFLSLANQGAYFISLLNIR